MINEYRKKYFGMHNQHDNENSRPIIKEAKQNNTEPQYILKTADFFMHFFQGAENMMRLCFFEAFASSEQYFV